MEKMFKVDGGPRQKLLGAARSELKGKVSITHLVGDILGARTL
jgi:hypothetical protein